VGGKVNRGSKSNSDVVLRGVVWPRRRKKGEDRIAQQGKTKQQRNQSKLRGGLGIHVRKKSSWRKGGKLVFQVKTERNDKLGEWEF